MGARGGDMILSRYASRDRAPRPVGTSCQIYHLQPIVPDGRTAPTRSAWWVAKEGSQCPGERTYLADTEAIMCWSCGPARAGYGPLNIHQSGDVGLVMTLLQLIQTANLRSGDVLRSDPHSWFNRKPRYPASSLARILGTANIYW